MATLRRYMDDHGMDYEEAAEAAVDNREFLLNSLFKPVKVKEESSNNERDDITGHLLTK